MVALQEEVAETSDESADESSSDSDADEEVVQLQKVVVTGSRLKRTDVSGAFTIIGNY